VRLENIQVKFVYQSHPVEVKVTGAKNMSAYPVCGWSAGPR